MTAIVADPERRFLNGANKPAKIGETIVHYGMEVLVYGRRYWVLDARPNGVGFKLFTVDEKGQQFSFKTREVTIAEDAAASAPVAPAVVIDDEEHQDTATDAARHRRSLLTSLATLSPKLHLIDVGDSPTFAGLIEHVTECLQVATRLPSVARLPWSKNPGHTVTAALIVMANATSPAQEDRLTTELAAALIEHNLRGDVVKDDLKKYARFLSSFPLASDLYCRGYIRAAGLIAQEPATDGLVPSEGFKQGEELKVVAAKADVGKSTIKLAPRPKARHKKDNGDEVAAYLRDTNNMDEVIALLQPQMPNVADLAAKYAHLSFGLAKMNITNIVRKLHKNGEFSI